jgi:hypothetical protein
MLLRVGGTWVCGQPFTRLFGRALSRDDLLKHAANSFVASRIVVAATGSECPLVSSFGFQPALMIFCSLSLSLSLSLSFSFSLFLSLSLFLFLSLSFSFSLSLSLSLFLFLSLSFFLSFFLTSTPLQTTSTTTRLFARWRPASASSRPAASRAPPLALPSPAVRCASALVYRTLNAFSALVYRTRSAALAHLGAQVRFRDDAQPLAHYAVAVEAVPKSHEDYPALLLASAVRSFLACSLPVLPILSFMLLMVVTGRPCSSGPVQVFGSFDRTHPSYKRMGSSLAQTTAENELATK